MFTHLFSVDDVASTNMPTREFLSVAETIGQRISAQAVWYDGRCNWLGMEPLERGSAASQPSATYRSLGPDLYSGTSGIALFLAELFAVTGDPLLRRTALAALRHALSRVDAISPSARLGLFSGWFGIALVAARLAILLEEPDLQTQAQQLLQRASAEEHSADEFDLMSGRAGAIAALVVLNGIFNDPALIDFAVRLGDEIIEAADKEVIGYSWKSPSLRNHHNLTGFSHGVSGVAHALLELYDATGISKYHDAALLAFQYEHHWFNADVANWPDFRKDPSSPSGKKHTYPYMTFWCHGAPGIALSRIRAYAMTHNEQYKNDAIAALKTTRASIESALDTQTGNFSLCHGLTGNAEVLTYGSEILKPEPEENRETALSVARSGIERYVTNNSPWPCGTHVGETPNLMLGMAGIGHYYLRLYQPSIPSILILKKEAWSRSSSLVS
jgi:lantibiotic biosynthesis protein